MRSHLLTAAFFLSCSSFLNDGYFDRTHRDVESSANVSDFIVQRLSNERVFISWHTENEAQQVIYEVLRKHGKRDLFVSLGVVRPKSREDSSAEYTFVDENNFLDTSYYCLKKTNVDSVIFYSVTKAVEGTGKDR